MIMFLSARVTMADSWVLGGPMLMRQSVCSAVREARNVSGRKRWSNTRTGLGSSVLRSSSSTPG